MPLVNRTFDQLINFTRTTAATFVGSNGLIQTTPQSRNLLTFTEEFDNAAWTKTNSQIVPNVNPAAASLGSELVTNGDFSGGATGWTPGPDWSISAGAASKVSGASAESLTQTVPLTSGMLVRVTYTVTAISGVVFPRLNGTANVDGVQRTATGVYTDYLVVPAGYTSFAIRANSTTTVTVDNISVQQVIGGALQAPDGTNTADTLIAAAGTGFTPRVADTSNPTTINAAAYTASIFVRAGTHTFLQIYLNNQSAEWANFTLTGAGTAVANGSSTATITALSGGWYRCTMSYTAGGTDRRPFFMMAASGSATRAQTWNPAGTETIFIWGAQLEQASAATDYTRNFGGLFPPRFDYDPVTLGPRGLLIEEQRTNLLLRSEEFDNGTWSKLRATVTANSTTAPDGTTTADTLLDTAVAGTHVAIQTTAKAASAITYAASVWLKADVRDQGELRVSDQAGNGVRCTFNLTTAAVGAAATFGTGFTAVSSQISQFANGWYRVVLVATSNTATTIGHEVYIANASGSISYTGTGAGFFVWGAQLEAGAFATSYIPTVASQVTRTADIAAIAAPNFASWYNQTAGSFVVEFQTLQSGLVSQTIYALALDSNASKRIVYIANGADVASTFDGTTVVTANDRDVTGAVSKVASAYDGSGRAIVSNGGSVFTGAVVAGYSTASTLNIGQIGGGQSFGHIRSIRYYPTRLSNAQLQALTA